MSTSLLLSSPTLPTDARTALANLTQTLDPPTLKVAVRFHAIGSAPQLKQKVFKISASSKFGAVVGFLRKRLYGKADESATAAKATGAGGLTGGQGLFCYVNSVFAPGLDEGVGNLWRVSLLFDITRGSKGESGGSADVKIEDDEADPFSIVLQD